MTANTVQPPVFRPETEPKNEGGQTITTFGAEEKRPTGQLPLRTHVLRTHGPRSKCPRRE